MKMESDHPMRDIIPSDIRAKLALATPAIRIKGNNPRHHLFWNNGTWWIHFMVHLPDYTKDRIRFSLQTHDLQVAQERRDTILRHLIGKETGVVTFCRATCFASMQPRSQLNQLSLFTLCETGSNDSWWFDQIVERLLDAQLPASLRHK